MASVEQTNPVQIDPDELANSVVDEDASLAVRRLFTIAGRDPFAEVEWEVRDAHIPVRIVPLFAPSEEAVLTLSIDRVAEAGVGTASRSALWILDETKTKYVLFADVRGEGGWRGRRRFRHRR